MIQTTPSRKRSSRSSLRRKRSQRLIINPPKLPKLTIHPPKPPQEQQQAKTVTMVLRLPKSPSPEIDHFASEWTQISLIGNGADASYDYSDICKVQAVMKVFNGLLSATRKVEAVEQKQKLSQNDVVKDGAAAPSHLHDRVRAELEMNNILQEALNCHHCEKTMYLKAEAMESDIRHGIYRYGEDPPFLLNRASEDVAPDEVPEDVWEPGYLQLATTAQHEQYLRLVEQYMNRNRARKVFSGMGIEVEQGYESQFACYCVDYHIHQHYIHRRSVLNYCRTNEEMEDMRDWKHRLALWTAQHGSQALFQSKEKHRDSDSENEFATTTSNTTAPAREIIKKDVPGISNYFPTTSNLPGRWSSPPISPTPSIFSSPVISSSPSTSAASSPPKPSSFPGLAPPLVDPWPKQQLALSSQISLHRHLVSPHERTARVRAARRRFRDIMKERAIQHRDGLIIANYEAAFALQKWHRGKGGPLALQRDGIIGELLKKYNH